MESVLTASIADLSTLSYSAGTVIGNPTIYCFDGESSARGRDIKPADEALRAHGIEPLSSLSSKEPLGILNGTGSSLLLLNHPLIPT